MAVSRSLVRAHKVFLIQNGTGHGGGGLGVLFFMEYEKTQKDNPHKLAINQHVFPACSIKRFAKEDGTVSVYRKYDNKSFPASPKNKIFCAKRVWDHGAETGYMKTVENKFQEVAESIIKGKIHFIGVEINKIISDFFVLWYLRAHYNNQPLNNVELVGIVGDNMPIDMQEKLEKLNIRYVQPDATISGRQLTGGTILIHSMWMQKQLETAQWIIARAIEGEFVVPDSSPNAIVPLTPILCLISQSISPSATSVAEVIGRKVGEMNKLFVQFSQKYYFARDFSKCPL